MHSQKIDHTAFSGGKLGEQADEYRNYWKSQPPASRVALPPSSFCVTLSSVNKKLSDDFREFLKFLNDEQVKGMLIGGYADIDALEK